MNPDDDKARLSLRAEIPLQNAVATRAWESPNEWRLVAFDGAVPSTTSNRTTYNSSGGEIWRFRCDKEDDVQIWIDAIAKATKRAQGR
jgi:hypothetical protein